MSLTAFTGQTSTHWWHMMQRLSSTAYDSRARWLKVMAPVGQLVTQRPQVMHLASCSDSLYGVSTSIMKPRPLKS